MHINMLRVLLQQKSNKPIHIELVYTHLANISVNSINVTQKNSCLIYDNE